MQETIFFFAEQQTLNANPEFLNPLYVFELQSIFPIEFIGHGFPLRTILEILLSYKRDPHVHREGPLQKADIDSSSCKS